MHRTRSSQQIYCKSPPHPGNPLVCAPTHTRVHTYTPPTPFTGGMHPALCDSSLQMGHAQGHAAKETSESLGAQSQEAPLKSGKALGRLPGWPPVEVGAQAGPSITPEGRAGGFLRGHPRQGETGGCEEEGWWETNQERPGTSCQRRSSWFCRRDSCHAETAYGLMASRAGRLCVAAVSAGNPRPVCSAG